MNEVKTAQVATANGVYDMSNIKSLRGLQEQIAFLKTSIKTDEKYLIAHLKELPNEALKASADAVLPSFINKMIANRSWKILASSAGMLANPFSKKLSFARNILGGAKKLGWLTAVKGVYNYWRNNKDNSTGKSQTANELFKKAPKPLK